MPRNPEETRAIQLTAGLISSGTAVTGTAEVDFPGNAFLLINVLAPGTTWSVALSTSLTGGSTVGTAVNIAGAAAVTGNTAGGAQFLAYHLNNKLSKFAYGSLSGTGTPTVSATIVSQGMRTSQEGLTANRPVEG